MISPDRVTPRRSARRRLACTLIAATAAAGVAVPTLLAADAPEVGKLNKYPLVSFTKPKKHYKVVLLQAHRSDAFAISSAQAVADFGKANGVSVTVNDAGGYQNVSKQIGQIEAAVLQKPDAIIFWSTDPTGVVPALKKAAKAGIKVVGYVQPPNMPVSFTVTGDFSLDGRTMADSLFKKMGGKGEAMLILGGAGSAYQGALQKGWNAALKKYPDIKVVAKKTIPDFDPSKVQSAVEDQLVRNPSMTGVMTTTTAMAASAATAFRSAGKTGFSVGEILGDCGQIQLLKNNQLSIVLGVPAVYYGRLAMASTIRMLEGKRVKKLTVIPGNVYTPDNIGKAPLSLEIGSQFRKGCS
jgi:ABC-type sugar transport system substrate-binding protein